MAQRYSPLYDSAPLPTTESPRRTSIAESSSDSDISYRDNLDDEPFDEKREDSRFQDEPSMENEVGYDAQPRRVSLVLPGGRFQLLI